MGFYSDFVKTNGSGQHCFDGAVLNALPVGYSVDFTGTRSEGELVRLKFGTGTVIEGVLLHRNGRVGSRDLAKDVLVLRVQELAILPDDIQAALLPLERVPEGRRRLV